MFPLSDRPIDVGDLRLRFMTNNTTSNSRQSHALAPKPFATMICSPSCFAVLERFVAIDVVVVRGKNATGGVIRSTASATVRLLMFLMTYTHQSCIVNSETVLGDMVLDCFTSKVREASCFASRIYSIRQKCRHFTFSVRTEKQVIDERESHTSLQCSCMFP